MLLIVFRVSITTRHSRRCSLTGRRGNFRAQPCLVEAWVDQAKAARLVVDLASTAGASEFIQVDNAHVSGERDHRGAWLEVPLGPLWSPKGVVWIHDPELGRLRP